MTTQETIDLFQRFVIGNYKRYPVALVRGEGSTIWDDAGNRYLDFFPGWGCDLIGHCPPRVVEAVRRQVGELIHVPNTWYTEAQGRLAQALSERTGWAGRCFCCNSGTEAVAAALKPDAVALAKALAGGVACGGLVARAEVAEKLRPGPHAATFGGNPLACAAALATIETIETDGLLARAGQLGEQFQRRFEALR